MNANGLLRLGRIIFGCGVGVLLAVLTSGKSAIEKYGISVVLSVAAIVGGLILVAVSKNKMKLEQLQTPTNGGKQKICPNCGLSLTDDCKQCPKCHTFFQ